MPGRPEFWADFLPITPHESSTAPVADRVRPSECNVARSPVAPESTSARGVFWRTLTNLGGSIFHEQFTIAVSLIVLFCLGLRPPGPCSRTRTGGGCGDGSDPPFSRLDSSLDRTWIHISGGRSGRRRSAKAGGIAPVHTDPCSTGPTWLEIRRPDPGMKWSHVLPLCSAWPPRPGGIFREALLQATERLLDPIVAATHGPHWPRATGPGQDRPGDGKVFEPLQDGQQFELEPRKPRSAPLSIRVPGPTKSGP